MYIHNSTDISCFKASEGTEAATSASVPTPDTLQARRGECHPKHHVQTKIKTQMVSLHMHKPINIKL